MQKYRRALLVMTAVCSGLAQAAPKSLERRALPFPEEAQSVETIEGAITAVYAAGDRLISTPYRKSFAIVTPLASAATVAGPNATRLASFGKLTDSRRIEILDPKAGSTVSGMAWSQTYEWRGIDLTGDVKSEGAKLLFASAAELMLVEADPVSLREVTRRTPARDLIRPARDPRGEPTLAATSALRQRFAKAWRDTGDADAVRLAGLARVPESWGLGKGERHYLAALRVPGFPLVQIDCALDEPSSCVVARLCNLEGASDLAPSSVAGIGISEKRREIVIGDAKQRRLLTFAFRSCYHLPKTGELTLPARMRDPVNLHVDALGRLWVSTKAPDDFLNASVYLWQADAW